MDPTNPISPEVPLSEPEKKDGHWIAIAAMALFVAASLVVVGFLYYQNQQLKSMLAGYQTQTTPTPVATADPTANWKTYTDTKLGFEFKYPESLTYKNLGKGVIAFTDNQDKTKFILNGFESLSSDQYQNHLQDIKINGVLSGQETFTDSQNRIWQTLFGLGQTYNFNAFLNQQNKYYLVTLSSDFGEEADGGATFKNFANQLLSTFKFLGPTSSPSATQKACTLEAKLCSDGSSVGRTGPNCEFAPCPSSY